MSQLTSNVALTVKPKVGVGPTTIGAAVLTVLGIIGTIIAAVQANDVATVVTGFSSLLVAVTALGGRYAQAVAQIRAVAPAIEQVAHEVNKSLTEA
jgi:hypothetical protein